MASGIEGHERRRYPRVWSSLGIRLGSDEKEEIDTESKDISACGVYCQVDRWLPLMTKLRVTIILPSKKIICNGIVVRVETVNNFKERLSNAKRHNIAIFFNEIKPRDRAYLIRYVKLQLTKKVYPGYSGN